MGRGAETCTHAKRNTEDKKSNPKNPVESSQAIATHGLRKNCVDTTKVLEGRWEVNETALGVVGIIRFEWPPERDKLEHQNLFFKKIRGHAASARHPRATWSSLAQTCPSGCSCLSFFGGGKFAWQRCLLSTLPALQLLPAHCLPCSFIHTTKA